MNISAEHSPMNCKGLIFDYGGTIDTDGVHWSEVLWNGLVAAEIPVSKADFRGAYVYGERTLARQPLIRPEHTMLDVLRIKVDLEIQYLLQKDQGLMAGRPWSSAAKTMVFHCYDHVLHILESHREMLHTLSQRYPLALVSNFYGNMNAVLRDFHLDFFHAVIESAVVGVRKPEPRIFQLGIEALGLRPEEVVVVGDSFDKDILPAHSLGCQTVWLRGQGWDEQKVDETIPTAIIQHLSALPQWLRK